MMNGNNAIRHPTLPQRKERAISRSKTLIADMSRSKKSTEDIPIQTQHLRQYLDGSLKVYSV